MEDSIMINGIQDGKILRLGIYGQVTYQMVSLGFQARQKGYRYLREAVCIACMEPSVLASVTKCLYPEVAKYFDTSDKQVERAIRNSIETAWLEGDSATLHEFFGEIYGDGTTRPTNMEVIGRLVDFVKEQS